MKSTEYVSNFCPTCGKQMLEQETAYNIIGEHEEPIMYCTNPNCGMIYFKVILEIK